MKAPPEIQQQALASGGRGRRRAFGLRLGGFRGGGGYGRDGQCGLK
jgi:hypothetical protein